MIKKLLFITIFLISFYQAYADSGNQVDPAINELSQRMDILEYKIPLWFEEKLNSQVESTINKITSISSQWISQQQNLLAIFALVFGIVAILFWVYISWISKKIALAENRIIKIQYSAENIENEIKSALEWKANLLYNRIQEEETKNIFKRLEKYPEEIVNSFTTLATRRLDNSYFKILKDRVLSKTNFPYLDSYKILIIQHFYIQMLKDESLMPTLKSALSQFYRVAFPQERNDMLNSVAQEYLLDSTNTNYLWFLQHLRRQVDQWILDKIEEHYNSSWKSELWAWIIMENSQNS